MTKIKNWTQEELDSDLKQDSKGEQERYDNTQYITIIDIMEYIERKRKEDINRYTQKKFAEEVGIGLATYADYLAGNSNSIKVITLVRISQTLSIDVCEILNNSNY